MEVFKHKFLEIFKSKIKKYKGLFIALTLLALISFLFSFFLENNFGDLLINLSATFIGIIFTIFIIDEIFSKQKETEYQESYLNAGFDINALCHMFISYLREPFGFKFPKDEIDINKDIRKEGERINREMIDEIIKDIENKMFNATPSDWKRLTINIFMIRNKFDQVYSRYINIIPPSVLGKLLSLRRSFDEFDSSFGLFADIFINEPDDWPKNKLGQNKNIEIRNFYLKIHKDNIIDVFQKTKSLFKELDKWSINEFSK